ncbi:MAG: divalent metal cation transporter, partial [Actinomycetota bacterium]
MSPRTRRQFKWRRHIKDYFTLAKNGVITGAADNDPSGIVTYTQVGALTHFGQLWLMFLTIPMLIVVEDMSARVGAITKKGLNRVIEDHYGRSIAWFAMGLVVVCNTATLGADMAGMAAVLELFTGISFLWFLVPIGVLILYMLVKESYAQVSRLLFIISPILLVYVLTVFLTRPNWIPIIRATLIPSVRLSPTFLTSAVALFGTTISAYLLFWQTTEEVEEKKAVSDVKDESLGVGIGMVYANVIFYFIILTGAVVLFGKVGGVETWAAADAARALRPLAGQLSYVLFAIGLLGSGLLA